MVESNVGKLVLGAWKAYGPYLVTVEDKNLNIELVRVSGTPHLMGIEIFSEAKAPFFVGINLGAPNVAVPLGDEHYVSHNWVSFFVFI